MKRISVVGVTGSGKTTLARLLAERLGVPPTELDAIYWQADWTPLSKEAFRLRVQPVLAGDRWVVDGNYSAVQDLVLARADTLVWLNYPLHLILRRLTRRTLRRVFLREELWNGNRERFREQFLSSESIFLWALKAYRTHKDRYESIMRDPSYRHLHVVQLRSPGALATWLETLADGNQ